MMVKIAILSHGLIHNTKVILSLNKNTHLCTNINFKGVTVKRFSKKI